MSAGYWDLTAHVRGALGEALVAEAVHQRHSDAWLHTPRHPGYDVSSKTGDLRVDAKVASIVEANLDGSAMVMAVEWDAGKGSRVLHESATHLGLAVIDGDSTSFKLCDGVGKVLQGNVDVDGRVFLVPANIAHVESKPIWSSRDHRPSLGRFRYLPMDVIESYEVEFRMAALSVDIE